DDTSNGATLTSNGPCTRADIAGDDLSEIRAFVNWSRGGCGRAFVAPALPKTRFAATTTTTPATRNRHFCISSSAYNTPSDVSYRNLTVPSPLAAPRLVS